MFRLLRITDNKKKSLEFTQSNNKELNFDELIKKIDEEMKKWI